MASLALSDLSIQHLPRLLAEALRERLDASPSDLLLPAGSLGTLKIERAWLPVFQLQEQTEIVLSVLSDDDNGEALGRSISRQDNIDIGFSLQKLLPGDPRSEEGKRLIDEVHDFSQRCLVAAFAPTLAAGTTWHPLRFERTTVSSTLSDWNQVTIVFAITYKAGVK